MRYELFKIRSEVIAIYKRGILEGHISPYQVMPCIILTDLKIVHVKFLNG